MSASKPFLLDVAACAFAGCFLLAALPAAAQPSKVEVRQGAGGTQVEVRQGGPGSSVKVNVPADEEDEESSKVEVKGSGSSVKVQTKPAPAPAASAPTAKVKAPKKLVLSGVNAKQKKTCEPGAAVEINGTGMTITLKGECGAITLNGTNNKVAAEAFGSIQVEGVNNAVTWKRPLGDKEPEVSVNGVGNQVSKLEK